MEEFMTETVQAIGFKISGNRVRNGNHIKDFPVNATMYLKRIKDNGELVFTMIPDEALKYLLVSEKTMDDAKIYANDNQLELALFTLITKPAIEHQTFEENNGIRLDVSVSAPTKEQAKMTLSRLSGLKLTGTPVKKAHANIK